MRVKAPVERAGRRQIVNSLDPTFSDNKMSHDDDAASMHREADTGSRCSAMTQHYSAFIYPQTEQICLVS